MSPRVVGYKTVLFQVIRKSALILFTLAHVLRLSLWPLLSSLGSLNLVVSCILFFKLGYVSPLLFGLVLVGVVSFFWWKDVSVEGIGGEYRQISMDNLKLGIVLFIFREVCFFSGFF